MSLEWEPLGPIGMQAPLKSNFKVDSTSHYRESIEFQYLMCEIKVWLILILMITKYGLELMIIFQV